MPGLISHIAFGQQFLKSHPVDEPQFIRGTVFADSRHITKLSRASTHWSGETLTAVVAEPNPWQAGMKFHNWLDDAWNAYYYSHGLVFGQDEPLWQAIKLLNEKLLFSTIRHPRNVTDYLLTISSEELSFTDQATAQAWHDLIAHHLFKPPTRDGWRKFADDLGIDPEFFKASLARIETLEKSERWTNRINDCNRELSAQIAQSA